MFLNKSKFEKKFSQLNSLLLRSFSNVRNDTNTIYQWINYLNKKNIQQEQVISQLRTELSHMPKSKEEIKAILDSHYSYEPILQKVRELNEKIEIIRREKLLENEPILRRINELEARMEALKKQEILPSEPTNELENIRVRLENLEQKKAAIKEKIIKRITKNSKEYVKSIILSYIKKYEKISALQLKEMVVDEQGLCSKSSFYRILEEIEEMEEIACLKKGKEKHYMAKRLRMQ